MPSPRVPASLLALLLLAAAPASAEKPRASAADVQQEVAAALSQADRGEIHTAIQRLEHALQRLPSLAEEGLVPSQLEQLWLRREAQELLPLGRPHERAALLKAKSLIERAYEVRRDPVCLLELGKVLHELGEEREAYEQVSLFLTAGRPDHPRRPEAQTFLGELTPSRLVVALPEGVPGGAAVRIDGRPLRGREVALPVGKHRLEVSGPWLEPLDEAFELGLAQVRVAQVRARPRATIRLSVPSAPPGMSLTLDGQPLAPEPVQALERPVTPGEHSVEAQAPGHRAQRFTVNVARGRTAELTIDLNPESGTPPWAFGAVAGAAVLSLGVGAYLQVRAQNEDRAEQARPKQQQSQEAQDQISRDRTGAIICFTVGGVFAVGAAVLAATTRWSSRAPRPRRIDVTWLPPAYSEGGVRVGLMGRF